MAFGPQFAKLADPDGLAGEGSAPRREGVYFNNSGSDIADGMVVIVDLTAIVPAVPGVSPEVLNGAIFGFGAAIQLSAGEGAGTEAIYGVADELIADGTWGTVCTYGVKLGVLCEGAITAGDLICGGDDPGSVKTAAVGTNRVIGFAVSDGVDEATVDVVLQLG